MALVALYSLATKGHDTLKASKGSLLLLILGFEGKAKLSAYTSIKGAQQGFARDLSGEWGRDGIRVNAIIPTCLDAGNDSCIRARPLVIQSNSWT